jgi:DUF4097 and DUF4098 domain-containing protein YvlB
MEGIGMQLRAIKNMALLFVAMALTAVQAAAVPTGHFERTLKVNGQVDMELVSGSGNINVHVGTNDTVQISAKIHGCNNGASWLFGSGDVEERIRKIEQNPPVKQQGNMIVVGRVEDRELLRNISVDYDVTVPAQTKLLSQTGSGDQMINGLQLSLTAKTGSGNITLENIGAETHAHSGSGDLKINNVKGNLFADTGSGNIRAYGAGGEIDAHTGSGDVEMHQVAAGDIKVGTGSGNVKLEGVKGGVRAQTGSGDIQAEGEATRDWRLGAGSGNITLKLPTQASFDLDARTSSGTLKVSHPVTYQGGVSKNHIHGKVNNGGVALDLHTGSGDIYID